MNFIDEKACSVVDIETGRVSINRISLLIKSKLFVKPMLINR
jgi:hypothetical protein